MKPVILILLMSIIVFSQCDSNLPVIGKSNSEKESIYSKITQMCFFVRLGGGPHGYKVIDNNDGTVSLVSYSSLGSEYCPPPFGRTETILESKAYMKKCIQGQVYRSAQNDCKGTGTAANYYGAQKFQLCPTNVSTCGNLSPAKISCMNDTTGNVTRDGSFSNFVSYYSEIKSYFKGRTDEIPSAKTDYYWDSTSKIAFNVDGQLANPTPNYDSFQYVLCY